MEHTKCAEDSAISVCSKAHKYLHIVLTEEQWGSEKCVFGIVHTTQHVGLMFARKQGRKELFA